MDYICEMLRMEAMQLTTASLSPRPTDRDRCRSRHDARGPGKVVLLLDHRSGVCIPVTRAARLCDVLGADLHAVLALPRKDESLFRAQVSYLARLLEAVRPQRGHELEVVHGTPGEAGVAAARERDPEMVVVDAGVGGREACRIVDDVGAPLFVARDPRAMGEMIAASDLIPHRLPVLSITRDYARALERPMTAFHNASPTDPLATTERRLKRLFGFAREAHAADAVVAQGASTLESLLSLAHERDADVVAVGHRPCTWMSRLVGKRLAERVVRRCQRSVMVVPIDEPN